jgi:hypothetical protein
VQWRRRGRELIAAVGLAGSIPAHAGPLSECAEAVEVFCDDVPPAPEPPSPWPWALAGGGAVLGAVGACEAAGCSPEERTAAALGALAAVLGLTVAW